MSDSSNKSPQTFRFDEMAILVKDRIDNPAEANVDRYVGLEHLDSDSLKIRRWGKPSDVEATKLLFKSGDIIFGKRRVYQRKLAVADFDGICSAHAMVLRAKPEVVLPEFLPFFMQSDIFMERALEISVGSLSPTINWKTLAKEEFALPPLVEQRQIVEVCNAHMNLKNKFQKAIDRCRSLKRSLLNREFPTAGELDNSTSLFSLISSGDLEFQTGPFGTVLSASEYRCEGWPIVNPSEMRDGTIQIGDMPCIDESTAQRIEKYRIREGDVLLARKGDFSKAVIAEQQHEGWIAGSDTILIRLLSDVLVSDYLYWFIQSPAAGRMLMSFSHGTVMPGLNEKMLGRLAFILPDTEQQHNFVDILTRLRGQERNLRCRLQDHQKIYGQILSMFQSVNEGGLY